MKIKKHIIGAWIILCPFSILAQYKEPMSEAQFSAGLGIGISAFPTFFRIVESLNQSDSFKSSNGPAFTGYFDWNPNNVISLGINGGFQRLSQEITGFSFSVEDSLYTIDQFSYSLNRTNIGITLKFYYDDYENLDLYTGIKAGISLFQFKVDVNDDLLVNELEKKIRFPMVTPSFQIILLGAKYYPSENIGMFCELGIGAPANLQAGISVRIPYEK